MPKLVRGLCFIYSKLKPSLKGIYKKKSTTNNEFSIKIVTGADDDTIAVVDEASTNDGTVIL